MRERLESFEISGEHNLRDKFTAIKNLAKSYEMRLRGFKWSTSGEKWVHYGDKALTGGNFITSTTGIISSFTEYANLITTKDKEKFARQYMDAFMRVNVMMLNDPTVPAKNYRAVIKMFKDTMDNTGDIITGSRELTRSSFREEQEEPRQLNSFD